MHLTYSRYELTELMAAFLAYAYGLTPTDTKNACLLEQLETNTSTIKSLAVENRVWTNIVATLSENPILSESLPSDLRRQIVIEYLTQRARAKKDLAQLDELETNPVLSKSKLILLKGSVRLFDDLYPTDAHRFMMDIDIYFENSDCLKAFAQLGYIIRDESFDALEDLSPGFLAEHSKHDHHLPPITSKSHKKRIELHQSLIQKFVTASMRKQSIDAAIPIPNKNYLLQLRPLDQLIMLLIHCRIADRYADFSTSRLRNTLEGYLLYKRLDNSDRNLLDSHFSAIGYRDELEFWKYMCLQLFEAPEFSHLIHRRSLQARYALHKRVSQNDNITALQYTWYFVYRLFSFRLTNSLQRKRLISQILQKNSWKIFLAKVRRIFGGKFL